MDSINISIYILTFVSFLTWLVFVITATKIYRLYIEFKTFKKTNDAELNHLVYDAKKIEKSLDLILEALKCNNKVLNDIYKNKSFSDEEQLEKAKAEFNIEDSLRHEKNSQLDKVKSDVLNKKMPPDEDIDRPEL